MNIKFISFKTFFTAIFLICAITLFYSCKKDGELVKATEVLNLSITSFSTNTSAAFEVVVNDALVEDSLYNGQTFTKMIVKMEGMQHIIIKDHFTDATLIDTTIAIDGKIASLTLLQLNADSDPILVGQTDENIPENHKLQSFFYTSDILPDSIGLQIYGCYYDPNTFELVKTDTLARFEKIRKGELSAFLPVKDSIDPATTVYFFQPVDVATQQPLANLAAPFDPAAFSGYQFSFGPGIGGTEKHYINNIVGVGTPEFFDVASDRLISY